MITWKKINKALGKVVSETLKEINLPASFIKDDVNKPIARRSFRIDLTNTDDFGTLSYAERGVDVEIYFYPEDKERPRDEINEASQALKAALRTGIFVEDFPIELEDRIEADASGGILALMFRLFWIEIAEEDGEFMEDLYLDGDISVDGSEELRG